MIVSSQYINLNSLNMWVFFFFFFHSFLFAEMKSKFNKNFKVYIFRILFHSLFLKIWYLTVYCINIEDSIFVIYIALVSGIYKWIIKKVPQFKIKEMVKKQPFFFLFFSHRRNYYYQKIIEYFFCTKRMESNCLNYKTNNF